MVPAEEEPAVPALLPAELTGDGLRDMGDGVSVLLQKGKAVMSPLHTPTHHFTAILKALDQMHLIAPQSGANV